MEKFIKVFGNIEPQVQKKVKQETVLIKNGAIISSTLNEIIRKNYSEFNFTITKKNLLGIWRSIISKAQNPREGSISRSWIRLFETLDKVLKLLYHNKSTLEKVLTEFRRSVKEKYGSESEVYKQSIYKTGISKEESIRKRQNYADKITALNINRGELPIFYDDEIYKVIDEYKNKAGLNKVIAVALATGSRIIEILKVSEYFETDKENYIRVKGVAKDKSDNEINKDKTIIKPLNRLTSKELIDLVKTIRQDLNTAGSNKEVSGRYNTAINKIVKSLFKERLITSHKLRYIASNLAYLVYGNNSVENTWIQQYLGHTSGDTTRTYQNINVKLRHTIKTSNKEAEAKISELLEAKKQNEEEHKQLKEQINLLQNKKFYSEYINVRQRTKEQKLQKLKELYEKAKQNNIYLTYRVLKSQYGYGSAILDDFYKKLK